MSYFGAYFGSATTEVSVPGTGGGGNPPTTVAVTSPYTPTEPAYRDHVMHALNRLPEYLRSTDGE